jgi:hypothetical protein
MAPTTVAQSPPVKFAEKTRWNKLKPFVEILGISLLDVYTVYALKIHLELVTGVALITLLFMMLQTEHERCDRVRAGWSEVRRATFATTSACQWASRKKGHADEQEYGDAARASLQELYSTILLHGQGSLREEYRKALNQQMQLKASLMQMLPVFGELDNKAEKMFKTWTLVWL